MPLPGQSCPACNNNHALPMRPHQPCLFLIPSSMQYEPVKQLFPAKEKVGSAQQCCCSAELPFCARHERTHFVVAFTLQGKTSFLTKVRTH